MASYNQVVLMGNLTRDVELRYTPAGTPVAKMGLAMNRKWRDKQDQLKDETTFVDVTAFGKTADVAHKYLMKGAPVLIGGRLHYHKWETPAGEKRSKIDVVVEELQLLPRRDGQGGYAGGARADAATAPMDAEESSDPFPASGFRGHETFETAMGDFGDPVQHFHEPLSELALETRRETDRESDRESEPATPEPEPEMESNTEGPPDAKPARGRGRRRVGGDA